jgi:hypothetical protein
VASVDASKFPTAVVTGDKKAKGALSVTVRNDTTAVFNRPVTVSVLASTDATADAGDVSLARSDKRLKLKPGQAKVLKFKTSMASLPAGAYTLLGAATVDNLTSAAAGPSLSVQSAFVHFVSGGTATPPKKPITAEKKATLSVPLRNDGNVATTKTPATYTLIFSTTSTEAGALYQTTTTGKIGLKPQQSKPQKVSFTVPAGASLAAGSYNVILKVSAESNDANDSVVATIPVTFSM